MELDAAVDGGQASDAGMADASPCETLAEGAECNDGNKCTQLDTCKSGECVGGYPIICEADDDCHVAGDCNPATGLCTHPVLPDGTSCDDGSICTEPDSCQSGVCTGVDLPGPPVDLCSDGICFVETSAAAGVDMSADTLGIQFIGGGAAFVDVDDDGWLDLLAGLEGDGGTPQLYANNGDGTFSNRTAAAGLPAFTVADAFMGVAAADYDNDGDVDIYLFLRGRNWLLQNDGTGVFTDVTDVAGVGGDEWSTAAAFGDFDRDGLLDLYVGNYLEGAASSSTPNVLYRNNGDGTFSDVTALFGVASEGATLAVSWVDWDDDGWLDLLVCNDFGAFLGANRLYDFDGVSFADLSGAVGWDLEIFCMSVAPGDYDRDGDMDYYFSNLGRSVLLKKEGAAFEDVSDAAGVAQGLDLCYTELLSASWGAGFHDFDNDGWLDLYISNGHVPAAASIGNPQRQPNKLFRSDGESLTFSDISRTAGVDDLRWGRGAAFADYDRDGDVDVMQCNTDSVLLYRNDSPDPGSFILVETRGRSSNRDGLGSRLSLELPDFVAVRDVNSGYGYASASQRLVHFGIGAAPEASRLTIRWLSGIEQHLLHVPANSSVLAVEPNVTVGDVAAAGGPFTGGATVSVSVTFDNQTALEATIAHSVELRAPGCDTVSSSVAPLAVPGLASATVPLSIDVPAGCAGGTPVAAELIVSAADADGALDQRSVPVQIVP